MKSLLFLMFVLVALVGQAQNRDPYKTQIVTTDLDHFWLALEKAKPGFDPSFFQTNYIDKGSEGLKDFMKGRIRSAENLAKVVEAHADYYSSIKGSTDSIASMKDQMRVSLAQLKEWYPPAIFPPVYFVIGALNSGGTSSNKGLIIGAEMYGLTHTTPKHELSDWLKTVIQPVNRVPHIVAHELIHFQQKYDGGDLLSASIKEGAADFMAELISGKHINQHVHEFANPREKELWVEFKERMYGDDYTGWLYSSANGRPNDLGYWMGYKITKAYFDEMNDKKQAVKDIMTIRDFKKFLAMSKYEEKVNRH